MKLHRAPFLSLMLASIACFLVGCLGSDSSAPKKDSGTSNGAQSVTVAHPDGDPSVSAEDGGPGFTGEGWITVDVKPLGDPRAVKGGTMLSDIPNWPENLRPYGTGANTYLNSIIESLIYETLLQIDPTSKEVIPALATHWKISDDKMKFTFRINPKAHWTDGNPVTAEDVVATWRLIMDETLVDPMSRETMSRFNEPVAKSKYIIEVECKEKDWRNFLSFSGFVVLPAHEIGQITGKDFLDKYNFNYTASSGPYIVLPGDIKDADSITITRRTDYWGEDLTANQGLYNFDKIRFKVIRDNRLAFDKACKGELDFIQVTTAKWWVEDLPGLEAVEKGQLIRRKVYTNYPAGIQGLAFNMRKPPLDDVRIRLALAHLYNRRQMLEKFAYNEYEPLRSYYPGSDAENPANKVVEYDPKEAAKLLADAGWKERGSDGILVKDGKRLSLTLTYRTPGLGKYYTTYKEDLKQAGVELNLDLITPETQWKNMQERNFEIISAAWSSILFPYPMHNFHSKMADEEGSNNITGLKNPEVDKIIEEYNGEFDAARRTKLLFELDRLLFNEHSYALGWTLPCERIIYWNKFGMPDTVLHRYTDWRSVFTTWWFDPAKEATLRDSLKTGKPITPIPEIDLHPWN